MKTGITVTDQSAVQLKIRLKRTSDTTPQGHVQPSFETVGDMVHFVATFANSTNRTAIPGLIEPDSECILNFQSSFEHCIHFTISTKQTAIRFLSSQS